MLSKRSNRALIGIWLCFWFSQLDGTSPRAVEIPLIREIVITNDTILNQNETISARIVIRASHITLDGNGAKLMGPGKLGDLASLETAGIGVLIEGATGVTLRNIRARGFSTGLLLRYADGTSVVECDFSDNYLNPKHGWDELPPRGGMHVEDSRWCVFRDNRANRVWDGLELVNADDNLVERNDLSECSNTCARLWRSSRNRFLENRMAYGIRIDHAAGEAHARDSSGVLIESGSNDNVGRSDGGMRRA